MWGKTTYDLVEVENGVRGWGMQTPGIKSNTINYG